MFEELTLFIQQQQNQDYKEGQANKAFYIIVEKIDQFEGKDITKDVKCYVKEIESK